MKGFAFITYSTHEEAERARVGMSGYGYKHLILQVSYATQRREGGWQRSCCCGRCLIIYLLACTRVRSGGLSTRDCCCPYLYPALHLRPPCTASQVALFLPTNLLPTNTHVALLLPPNEYTMRVQAAAVPAAVAPVVYRATHSCRDTERRCRRG